VHAQCIKVHHKARGIPLTIYVTHRFSEQSPDIQRMKNGILPMASFSSKEMVNQSWKAFVPPQARLEYFDNQKMEQSVGEISRELEQAGVVQGAYQAFSTLKPIAFKVDLWRLMILWSKGGVYLDFEMRLERKLSEWINFQSDELVLVKDPGADMPCGTPLAIWNAMLASPPRHHVLALVINKLVSNVHQKMRGTCPLDITGPSAFGRALLAIPGWQQQCRVEYAHQNGRVVQEASGLCIANDNTQRNPPGNSPYDAMWHTGHIFN